MISLLQHLAAHYPKLWCVLGFVVIFGLFMAGQWMLRESRRGARQIAEMEREFKKRTIRY